MKPFLAFFLGFSLSFFGVAQNINPEFVFPFQQNEVHQIKVQMAQTDLNWLLDQSNWYQNQYQPCQVSYKRVSTDSILITNAGIRLRGNTSRNAEKKSFKLDFDEFVPNQMLFNLEKINLKGAHNDPSVVRERLSLRIFREMNIPAARANHVEFYINGEYKGLYVNIEQIDKRFLISRFGNNDGNLYKCGYGANLVNNNDVYNNSLFELETNVDINNRADLENLIDVLNNTPHGQFSKAISEVFNVPGFLAYYAVEVLIGHWDGYAYNKNNFYLYNNTATQKMEFIPYDPDNTFGIDWIGANWTTRNIYQWHNQSGSRPLVTKLLAIPEFYKIFSEQVFLLLENYFNEDFLFPIMDDWKNQIFTAIQRDDYYTRDYGFNINTFLNAYNTGAGGHVTIGIKPYITQRSGSAYSQLNQSVLGVKQPLQNGFKVMGSNLKIEIQNQMLPDSPTQFQVFDLSGRLINQGILTNQKIIEVTVPGVYFVRLNQATPITFKTVVY